MTPLVAPDSDLGRAMARWGYVRCRLRGPDADGLTAMVFDHADGMTHHQVPIPARVLTDPETDVAAYLIARMVPTRNPMPY